MKERNAGRRPYPSDVSDEEWAFVAPYLTLMDPDAPLAAEVQVATGQRVELAYVDQGYTGEQAEDDAAERGIYLEVVKLTEAKRGFVLLPRRWVMGRSFAWLARFRRLARDYERLPTTLAALHFIAFAVLMLKRLHPHLGTLLTALGSA